MMVVNCCECKKTFHCRGAESGEPVLCADCAARDERPVAPARPPSGLTVLTIDPIWVWAIFEKIKLVENRSWTTRHRGALAIHASMNTRRESAAREWIASNTLHLPPSSEVLSREYAGRVLGLVDLVDCVPLAEVPEPEREFAIGPMCWRLANARLFSEPFRATGKQGLWTL